MAKLTNRERLRAERERKSSASGNQLVSNGYMSGAMAGGLIGDMASLALRKNVIIGMVAGFVAGGYLGMKLTPKPSSFVKK